MLYNEFLKLSGLTEDQVTVETYANVIEPMYQAVPNISKQQFVDLFNRNNIVECFPNKASTLRKMSKVCASCISKYNETKLKLDVIRYQKELEDLGVELAQLELHREAGMPEVSIHYRDGGIYKINIKIFGWISERHNAIYQVSQYAYNTELHEMIRE